MPDIELKSRIGMRHINLEKEPKAVSAKKIDEKSIFLQTGVHITSTQYDNINELENFNDTIHGYRISDIVENSFFLESVYLVLYGDLPSAAILEDFERNITRRTMLHEEITSFFRGLDRNLPPISIMASVFAALDTFYSSDQLMDLNSVCMDCVGKIGSLCAWSYKYKIGEPFIYPRYDLDYTSNILHQIFALPTEEYFIEPLVARSIDRYLMIQCIYAFKESSRSARLSAVSRSSPFTNIIQGLLGSKDLIVGLGWTIIDNWADLSEPIRYIEYVERFIDDPVALAQIGVSLSKHRNTDLPRKFAIDALKEASECFGASRSFEWFNDVEIMMSDRELLRASGARLNAGLIFALAYKDFSPEVIQLLSIIGRIPGFSSRWRQLSSLDKDGPSDALEYGGESRTYVNLDARS